MYTGEKVPFANEKINMNEAIKIINLKKLGVLILKNNKGITTGILTDGDIKRLLQKNDKIHNLKVKSLLIKNPVSVNKDILAAKALTIMNEKKITCLCVHEKNKKKTIGLIDIHSILNSKIL